MRYILATILWLFPASCFAQVAISEVMWAGSPISTADEWLEIVNISGQNIDISNWKITRRGSDGSPIDMIVFEEDAILEADQYFLIANNNVDDSVLSVTPDVVSSSVSLANSKLYLELVNNEGEVIDAVDDGVGAPFAGGKDPFASMERIDLFASGEDKSNWQTATVSIGFDDAQILGTPGSQRIQNSSSSSSSSDSSESSSEQSIPAVRITEALTNPTGSDDYEWIEVANLGEEPVNILGWMLSDGSKHYEIEARNSDGYVLAPGEHTVFFKYQSAITLTDSDVITLANGDTEIDRLPLSDAGEEVSIGRTEDGSRKLFCRPTPREENGERILEPQIEVQSGRSTDYTKVTLNLNTVVDDGSLKSAECFWNFDDGTDSKKCNPPSHSWDYLGVYDIELTVKTICGDEIVKKFEVVVLEKNRKKKEIQEIKEIKDSKENHSNSARAFLPAVNSIQEISSSNNEQKMYSSSSIFSSNFSSKAVQVNPIDFLTIRYQNVKENQFSSSSNSSEAYEFRSFQDTRQPPNNSETGLPWVLLFSQSVLWVIVAGKRLI